jgi:hypothetical protein
VHYERGGVGHSFKILIVNTKLDAAEPTVILDVYTSNPLKNYNAFIQAMQAGKLISSD